MIIYFVLSKKSLDIFKYISTSPPCAAGVGLNAGLVLQSATAARTNCSPGRASAGPAVLALYCSTAGVM